MSKCDPIETKVTAPPFQPFIEGVYHNVPWTGMEIAPVDGKKNVELIFLKACTGHNTYWEKEGGKSLDQDHGISAWSWVYCRLPRNGTEEKPGWFDTWDKVKHQAEIGNPHNFLSSPINWIRYELNNLATNAMHWWLEVDDPFTGDYGKGGDNDSKGVYDFLVANTLSISLVVAVISLLVVAARMALQRNAQPAADAARSLFTLVVVAAAGLTILKLLLLAGDRFSRAILINGLGTSKAGGKAHCDAVEQRIKILPQNFDKLNFFLFLLCVLFLVIGSLVLYIYMLGRILVVTMLAGLLPLAAAGTATESGRSWFGRQLTYLFAFVMVKPTCTVVLVVSLRMSKLPAENPSAAQQLGATMMLFLGTVMLPAMTRLAFPFTSPAARGEKGAQAAVVGTAAVGAKAVKGGMSIFRR
ncbi:hypothetical protein [Streptodolium elevatio]